MSHRRRSWEDTVQKNCSQPPASRQLQAMPLLILLPGCYTCDGYSFEQRTSCIFTPADYSPCCTGAESLNRFVLQIRMVAMETPYGGVEVWLEIDNARVAEYETAPEPWAMTCWVPSPPGQVRNAATAVASEGST